MTNPKQTAQTTDRTGDESPPLGSLSRRHLLQTGAALSAALAAGAGTAMAQSFGDGNIPSGDDLVWEEVASPPAPTGMDFDPQGRIWLSNKGGEVTVVDPETGNETTALTISVFTEGEQGLVGIAVDPDFEQTGWVYITYSDPSADNVVSRFTANGDQLDPNSEVEIIRIPNIREQPYHIGGGIDFGPDGVLHISLGDDVHDTSAHVPHGPNVINDARGTAADTSDLRGSILRIIPEDNGGYSIPDGNLFPEDEYASEIQAGTVAPEIFALGFRNPFKVTVDDETGWVFTAEQAHQAYQWDENSGPPGLGTISRWGEAGVNGWPLFRAEFPYISPESGQPYDPNAPINDSPNNDGLEQLPPLNADATLAYAPGMPIFGSGGGWDAFFDAPTSGPWDVPDDPPGYPEITEYSPIAGTVIRTDPSVGEGLPQDYDGLYIFGLWNTGDIYAMALDDNGDMVDIDTFLPNLPNVSFITAEMGPDNRLYLLDWGTNSFDPAPGEPTIYRIDSTEDPEPPQVDEEFELEGQIDGWIGVSPASIAGEENPTLDLEPGLTYRVEWTNVDGISHNFAIRNENEEVLVSTDLVGLQGESASVEFTATSEMDHYVCQPHPTSMRGGIGEEDEGIPDPDTNLGNPAAELTVEMTGENQFSPRVAHVQPGGTVTWEHVGGQAHNAVAYHPDTNGDQQRIPDGAEPWESDLLSTGGTDEHTFEEPGVYDYACTPHEGAGMVASVVVGWPDPDDEPGLEPPSDGFPNVARQVLEADNEFIRAALEDGGGIQVGDYTAQDLNGDGKYTDVNGNDNNDFDDVVTFFEEMQSDGVQNNVDAFDFNDNGSIDFDDIVALFETV